MYVPSRNILKVDLPDSYYHVYFRGTDRSLTFRDAADYEKMLQLFARYLSLAEVRNAAGISYPNYYNKLELAAFCLLPNSAHLLVHQRLQGSMTAFMRSLLTGYSMYFNKRYKRRGPLFESRYRASLISDESYVEHVARYIHLRPRRWRDYEYSSLPYYLQQITDEWLVLERASSSLRDPDEYVAFMANNKQHKEMMNILKHELADEAKL